MSLRLVFAGTPAFATPCLEAIVRGKDEVLAVYTQPDRPSGRGRQLAHGPVKALALHHGIEVRQPESLRHSDAQEALLALQPDLMIVVAYGLLLPQKVLDIPRYGCWNVHASLLPRWRGAAPIQRAIEAGDLETGVCLMQMEKGLDTGPVLLSKSLAIAPDETSEELHDRLAALGAQVLDDGVRLLRAGLRPMPRAQSQAGIVYARKLEKAEAQLDWRDPADVLARRVRAFLPWPVAEARLADERVRIHRAAPLPISHSREPGDVLEADQHHVLVACGEGALSLLQLQREGGRVVGAGEYLNARPALRR